jgi:CubicO group peptidase (beta-lactamase class C family)
MVKIKRTFPVFAAFVLAFAAWSLGAQPLPLAKPEEVGMSSQKLAKISQALKKEVEDGSFRGAVVMVARKGKLVYQDSIGMQAPSAKMTRDSIFRIYSMTKPIVSVAAMMLVEDGTIQLTDPVSKYLPGFDKLQVSVPAKNDAGVTTYTLVPQERQMTVQDLLRHTSGLAYGEITQNAPVKDGYEKIGVYYKDHDFDSRNLAPADQIAKMATVPLACQPGTTWHYSLASDMLGRVVERASGKRLADFLDERLFKPLKMVDSGFWVPAAKMPRVAEPLEKDRFAGRAFPLVDVSTQPMNDSGGAGGVSTAADYLRFSQMLMNGGTLNGVRVMSRTTVKLMTSDHLGTAMALAPSPGELLIGSKGYGFGLGFAVRTAPGRSPVPGNVGDYFWGGAYGTYFWIDPKEELYAVLMLQGPADRIQYRYAMRQLVYQALV